MGAFSKIGHKLGHHVKRHWKGVLTGGVLDPTVQRHFKSLYKGNLFNRHHIQASAGKYLSGQSRSSVPYVYVPPSNASQYVYQARPISSLMR